MMFKVERAKIDGREGNAHDEKALTLLAIRDENGQSEISSDSSDNSVHVLIQLFAWWKFYQFLGTRREID